MQMTEWHMPRAMRPYRNFFAAIAPMLEGDAYLGMDEREFVGTAMKAAGGSLDPSDVAKAYQRLIAEAGMKVPPPTSASPADTP